jgi:hypothetical protein
MFWHLQSVQTEILEEAWDTNTKHKASGMAKYIYRFSTWETLISTQQVLQVSSTNP